MKVVGYMRVNSIEQLGGTQVAEKEKEHGRKDIGYGKGWICLFLSK